MRNKPLARILIVAGSDSGGGAGIQGDIKTVAALGGYAMTAVTALTAQNTLGVSDIHPVPAAFVAAQMRAVLSDIGADAVKTGMLLDGDIIRAVAEVLNEYPGIPLIVDPVMIAKGGASLLESDAIAALKNLLPRAALVTPNTPEAEALTGIAIATRADMRLAAERLRALDAAAVLITGGHLPGDRIYNLLLTEEETLFEIPRLPSRSTHGTGCALASAIATSLAQGMTLKESVARAMRFVSAAIAAAPGIGQGHGPLGHCCGKFE